MGQEPLKLSNGRNMVKRSEDFEQKPAPIEVACTILMKMLQKALSAQYDMLGSEKVQTHNVTGMDV